MMDPRLTLALSTTALALLLGVLSYWLYRRDRRRFRSFRERVRERLKRAGLGAARK